MTKTFGLEASLVGLIGAGLGSVATGLMPAVEPGVIANGLELAKFIARSGHADFGAFIEHVATAVWIGAKSHGLETRIVASHLAALPELLDSERIDGQVFAVALAEAQAVQRHGGSPDVVARRLVEEIVAHLSSGAALQAAGLDERVTRIVLQGLFTGLLARPRELIAARAGILAFGERLVRSGSDCGPELHAIRDRSWCRQLPAAR